MQHSSAKSYGSPGKMWIIVRFELELENQFYEPSSELARFNEG